MRFSFPGAKSPEEAEELYEATKKHAVKTMGWGIREKRIRSITFRVQGKALSAVVGRTPSVNSEVVCAILDSNAYLVCTPNRGYLRGTPMIIGKDEVYGVELFDSVAPVANAHCVRRRKNGDQESKQSKAPAKGQEDRSEEAAV
jgi:hypothetical protein